MIEKFVAAGHRCNWHPGTPDQQSKGPAMPSRQRSTTQTGQPNATAAYLDAYTQALNTQLLPLAQSSNVHARLNAAIVTSIRSLKCGE